MSTAKTTVLPATIRQYQFGFAFRSAIRRLRHDPPYVPASLSPNSAGAASWLAHKQALLFCSYPKGGSNKQRTPLIVYLKPPSAGRKSGQTQARPSGLVSGTMLPSGTGNRVPPISTSRLPPGADVRLPATTGRQSLFPQQDLPARFVRPRTQSFERFPSIVISCASALRDARSAPAIQARTRALRAPQKRLRRLCGSPAERRPPAGPPTPTA